MKAGRPGIALVAALLTLASLSTLGLATTLLLSFDLKLAENRQEQALARANSTTFLTLALLTLEAGSAEGELPGSPPAAVGIVDYRRLDPQTAVVVVEGREGEAVHRIGVRIELRKRGQAWRLHIVQRR